MAFNMTAAVEAANKRKSNIRKWGKFTDCEFGKFDPDEIKELPTDDVAAVEEVVENMTTEDIALTLIELVQLLRDKDTAKQAYEDGFTDMIYALRGMLDSGTFWDYADKKMLEGK